ncbi:hypothetical protein [Erythrobacter sp. MTPC3]|uniref:hypothetical protein n=1 Tax=Erythrobacter sp. MTPC3 TaxID=3056564 RepID=UPI0036F3DB35
MPKILFALPYLIIAFLLAAPLVVNFGDKDDFHYGWIIGFFGGFAVFGFMLLLKCRKCGQRIWFDWLIRSHRFNVLEAYCLTFVGSYRKCGNKNLLE